MMTKSHTGYSSCPRCTAEGQYVNGRVALPTTVCSLRTDSSFRNQTDDDHHRGTSVLLKLPIDAVRNIPFDYMHLVCLGVTKKLILLWLTGPLSVQTGPAALEELSQRIVSASRSVPAEFVRKGRAIAELDRWKATELRLFLLYTGPVVLQNILSPALYSNFLVLHCAMSLLVNEDVYSTACICTVTSGMFCEAFRATLQQRIGFI